MEQYMSANQAEERSDQELSLKNTGPRVTPKATQRNKLKPNLVR